MSRVYNHKFQPKDSRDFIYKLKPLATPLPESYYLVKSMIQCPILDQLNIGSCVSQATYVILYIMSKGVITPSRLQLYLCNREIDGSSLSQDTGATIRGAMKAIAKYSACNETIWPYKTLNFDNLPPRTAFTNTYNIMNFVYTAVPQDITSITNALASGLPIILGIRVYTSFESSSASTTGIIPMPNVKKEKLLGGHAITIIGYDTTKKLFSFQNSWGTKWGNNGYGYLPFDYVISKSLASDLTTISFTM